MGRLGRKHVTILFGLLAIGLAAGVFIYYGQQIVEEPFRREYKLFRSIRIGMDEKEVIALLGQPYKIYEAESAPEDYYVEGYAKKKRDISSKVYIYVKGEPIAYIYFDDRNKVEDVFVGGS